MTQIKINPQSYSIKVSKDGDVVKVVNSTSTSRVDVSNFVPVATGLGDMLKSVYDIDNDGVVDNSEQLGGQLPSYYLDTSNLTGYLAGLDQSLNTSSDVAFSSATLQNLYVAGSSFIVNAGQVSTSDNIIELNAGEIGSGVTAGSAGIQIDRGGATDYYILFDETDDAFKVGQLGSLQTAATREDSPVSNGVPFYNSSAYRFDTDAQLTYNDSTDTLTVANLSSSTGVFSGKIGIGTSSPLTSLHLISTTAEKLRIGYTDAETTYLSFKSGTSGSSMDVVSPDAGNGLNFQIDGTTKMLLDSTGKVGIGTTSPNQRLWVAGDANTKVVVDGTSTGAIQFNTGTTQLADIYSNAANKDLIFRTNGSTNAMRIDNAGYVGIGTTSPVRKLSVYGTSTDERIRIETNNNGGVALVDFINGQGSWSAGIYGDETFQIRDVTNGKSPIRIEQNTPDSLLYLDNTGAVGIGTTSPSSLLHITGSDPAIRLEDTGDKNWWVHALGTAGTQRLSITETNTSTERLTVLNGGNVGIGTTSPSTPLDINSSTNQKGITVRSATDNTQLDLVNTGTSGTTWNIVSAGGTSGWGAGNLAFVENNLNARMVIQKGGNVGIGTASPETTLQVVGNMTIGSAALATSDTSPFLYITSMAGTPTGTPTSYTGRVPMVYDSSNNYLYIYNGGWKKTTVFS